MVNDRHQFMGGSIPIFHVVDRASRAPLYYWYCLDRKDSHKDSGPSHFDIRLLPEKYWAGRRPGLDRHVHEDALIAAIQDGHDFTGWQSEHQ